MSTAIKLALLGRNIAHSKSPEIYRRLISSSVQYDLLDIARASDIPTWQSLASTYLGINITAPWKEHFARHAVPEVAHLQAVNCLRFTGQQCEATNTDWTALKNLLPALLTQQVAKREVVLLGSGVMARVTLDLCSRLSIDCTQYARSRGDDLTQLDLDNEGAPKLIINACSRDYVFSGKLRGAWLFWDLNYAHSGNHVALQRLKIPYLDGLSLLEEQAKHAVQFWNRTLSH